MSSPLTRRELSALALPLLAGCLSTSNANEPDGNESNDDDPDANESDAEAPDPPTCTTSIESPDPYPDIQIESDPVSDEANVRICVTPIEPFTDESPARIAFELTNTGDSAQEYTFGFSPPFSPSPAEHVDTDEALLTIPDDREYLSGGSEFVPEEPTDGCWRALSSYGADDIGRSRAISPGETLREEYTVLAHPHGDCLVPGTYRSEKEYAAFVDGTWGFEITLSE